MEDIETTLNFLKHVLNLKFDGDDRIHNNFKIFMIDNSKSKKVLIITVIIKFIKF